MLAVSHVSTGDAAPGVPVADDNGASRRGEPESTVSCHATRWAWSRRPTPERGRGQNGVEAPGVQEGPMIAELLTGRATRAGRQG